MNFLAIPLRTEGKILVPVSTGSVIESDYLYAPRAIVDICERKGWSVARLSKKLARRVADEFIPLAVLETGGGVLMAVWKQVTV